MLNIDTLSKVRKRYVSENKSSHVSVINYIETHNTEKNEIIYIDIQNMPQYSNNLIKNVIHDMGYELFGKGSKKPKSVNILSIRKRV